MEEKSRGRKRVQCKTSYINSNFELRQFEHTCSCGLEQYK